MVRSASILSCSVCDFVLFILFTSFYVLYKFRIATQVHVLSIYYPRIVYVLFTVHVFYATLFFMTIP